MEKKFKVLRVVGTLWKILAWVTLITGILSSIGVLLFGILGSSGDILRQFGQQPGMMPRAMGMVSGVVGFFVTLIVTAVYFLILYAVGELIFLLLAIEENTRLTVDWMQYWSGSANQAQGARSASAAAPTARQPSRTSPPGESEA